MDKMDIEVCLDFTGLDRSEIEKMRKAASSCLDKIWGKDYAGSTWTDLPLRMLDEDVELIQNAATYVQGKCKKMIVIGIGGSFLGAKAAIEALDSNIQKAREAMGSAYPFVEVEFAGYSLSAVSLSRFVKMVQEEDVMLCVISKSGETMEVKAAFAILEAEMLARFGEKEAAKRIMVITDPDSGTLRRLAMEKNFLSLEIPSDIGGRYSVLTAVGLLPMAVMGVDIKEVLAGAAAAVGTPRWDTDALDYAIARNLYRKKGKRLEIFEVYETCLSSFTLWLMQLFGESEGKSSDAIYPTSLEMSRDLHSIGQYLQEGAPIFFETVISAFDDSKDLVVPGEFGKMLGGRSLNELNVMAQKAAIKAHFEAGIPVVKIGIKDITPFNMGQLFYFFEASCAISALLQGVNPFDQPGVENYKNEMSKLLS